MSHSNRRVPAHDYLSIESCPETCCHAPGYAARRYDSNKAVLGSSF